ncbi:DUF2339 domain-containing protein [Candidatus Leptofilum sp.]|uniref:DUF2339 domain-containing protein n=1 Tax=Candidatus Leptofilum sp. TaxID=3241576 RepID=UPI003B58F56A
MSEKTICPFCGTENEPKRAICANCQTNFRQADLFNALAKRLGRLEQTIATLQTQVSKLANEPADTPPDPEPALVTAVAIPPPAPTVSPPPAQPAATPQPIPKPKPQPQTKTPTEPPQTYLPENIWQSDFWLNKIGLGLLLLALVFLFNYAVNQGWIGPPVRVAIGLILGTGLLGIGYKTARERPYFGQAVQGGGIAAYYITGFAAFQLYGLISLPVAFGFMTLVTLLAFALSLRQKEAMLSLIGGLGGLATPFLLSSGDGNVGGLIIYTCLICGSLVLIYFFQGWQILLWLANVGGWVILAGSMLAFLLFDETLITPENITLQSGILLCLLMFWAMPVLRYLDWLESPNRLPPIKFGFADTFMPDFMKAQFRTHPRLTILLNPIIALWLTLLLWQLPGIGEGLITLGTAVLFGLLAVGLSSKPGRANVWIMHSITAFIFLTVSLVQFFDGTWLLLALAVEAAALHLAHRHIRHVLLELGMHLLSLAVGIFLFVQLLSFQPAMQAFHLDSWVELFVIGLFFAIAALLRRNQTSDFFVAYLLTAHAALLFWLRREFSAFDIPGLVTFLWAFYAVWLHWDAQRHNQIFIKGAAHLLSLVVTVLLFEQILTSRPETAVFNLQFLLNLAIIVLLFATTFLFADAQEAHVRHGYRLMTHVAILTLFWQAFNQLSGQGLVTVVWGIYAIILLLIALTLRRPLLRLVALATLFVLVGKLFLVDLVVLETVWRILLFAGIGSVFLVISYFYSSWLGLPER